MNTVLMCLLFTAIIRPWDTQSGHVYFISKSQRSQTDLSVIMYIVGNKRKKADFNWNVLESGGGSGAITFLSLFGSFLFSRSCPCICSGDDMVFFTILCGPDHTRWIFYFFIEGSFQKGAYLKKGISFSIISAFIS